MIKNTFYNENKNKKENQIIPYSNPSRKSLNPVNPDQSILVPFLIPPIPKKIKSSSIQIYPVNP